MRRPLWFSAFALVALAALPLCAQQSGQYWPPDDDSPGGVQPQPIPSYPPQGQYNQPQYPQPQAQYPQQQQAYGDTPAPQEAYGQPTQQPLSPDQLSQLIAPIALYPDALIAQILAASTYPAQISAADQWLQSMGNAPAAQIAAGADAQTSWDPSIKALTAFPQVLSMLDRNLQWTTSLGNAYYNQPQDVMQTLQAMRERAQDAGNLQSTPQAQVQDNQGYIGIAPVNPQIVYVPTYDPWTVYGQPIAPYPGFAWMNAVGAVGSFFVAPVQYGLGFAMSAFLGAPWGFLGWGLDWFGHAVLFNHNDYCTRSYSVHDWGFPHGGPRAFPGYPHSIHGGGNYAFNHGYGSGNALSRSNPRPTGGPANHWGDARTQEGFNRGFPSRSNTWGHPSAPTQQAFAGHGPEFGRPTYGSTFAASPRDNHISRPGMALSAPSQTYRASQYSNPRSGFSSNRAYNSYGGTNSYGGAQAWRQPQQRSEGFSAFGGTRNVGGFNGHASQTYSYNGGGHSSWGNSGGGYKASKMPHESFGGGGSHSFSGGGHSFGGGGGHSFGEGGHSSGGSHGGGHSGGGHHR